MMMSGIGRALLASLSHFTFISGKFASCNHEVAQAKEHLKLVMILCQSPVTGLAVAKNVFVDMEGMFNERAY